MADLAAHVALLAPAPTPAGNRPTWSELLGWWQAERCEPPHLGRGLAARLVRLFAQLMKARAAVPTACRDPHDPGVVLLAWAVEGGALRLEVDGPGRGWLVVESPHAGTRERVSW